MVQISIGQLERQIMSHPLYKRYLDYAATLSVRLDNGLRKSVFREETCTKPWHAQGLKLLAATQVLSLYRYSDLRLSDDGEDYVGAAKRVLQSEVYWWTTDVIRIAQNMPLPRHVISRDILPFPDMFWAQEKFLGDGVHSWCWGLVQSHSKGFGWSTITWAEDGKPITVATRGIEYGKHYPEDFTEQELNGVTTLLSMLAFLNSPYIDKSPKLLPKNLWKKVQKLGQNSSDSYATNVITMRRRLDNVGRETSDDKTEREYHHRWWVSGHIRNQWYPSVQSHKLIWIPPYMKGPDDAPLKEKVYAVVR